MWLDTYCVEQNGGAYMSGSQVSKDCKFLIYKMKSTDISILIIIHKWNRSKSYILRTLWLFCAPRVRFMFSEKNYNFTYVSWWKMWHYCCKNVQKYPLYIFNAQSQPSKMLWFSPPPPTYFRPPTCFLIILRMSLRHLVGWLSIIQKIARDLISVNMVHD